MKLSSTVLDKGKESFDLNKCIICQNSGSLVSTENGRIRTIEDTRYKMTKFIECQDHSMQTSDIIWTTNATKKKFSIRVFFHGH